MLILTIYLLIASNCIALYEKNDRIVELTPNNFKELVIEGNEIWIVEFFAPWCGHCQNLVPEFTKAANALDGVIKVGAVNSDRHKDLTKKYGIKGLPTIYIFGSNKNQPIDYDGIRSAKSIAETALKVARDKVNQALSDEVHSSKSNEYNKDEFYSNNQNIVELTDNTFVENVLQTNELWLIIFYAPWCGYCKSFAPYWVKIAKELEGKIKLGVVDATTQHKIANKYNIQRYPTINFFTSKILDPPIEYDGEYTKDAVLQWSLEKLTQFMPNPEVIQITDNNSFKVACEEKSVCVFAFLPHIFDCQSDCRKTYLKLLGKLGEQFKRNVWGWAWSEAGSQPHVEAALGFGGFGYPALAVINLNKLKYSIFKGSFSEKSLHVFLRDIAYGKEKCNFLKNRELLDIISVDKWNGNDRLAPEENEYDEPSDALVKKDEL